ncbi:MAG TPA: ATP-binding protein [Anaerolineae bacterium]|nr:ATP-binding protein [Anaerolineae bacterium]HNU02999.1 ATP-binding protein [Anaerolineae bacterium]
MTADELVVSSDLDALPQVIGFVRQASMQAGLPESAIFACELATDEACTNIIDHAYAGRDDGVIRVACWSDADEFVVQLHDQGAAFDPAAVREPPLTEDLAGRPLGGLGLHFMRSLMDEVRFDFDPVTGNTLTMVKRF